MKLGMRGNVWYSVVPRVALACGLLVVGGEVNKMVYAKLNSWLYHRLRALGYEISYTYRELDLYMVALVPATTTYRGGA